ncbi:DoxX family protein [Nocardia sp. NBC_00881]|uniref:DoxX family protein n=1 Tax=Nocardia sp. NBC_00881 TaxID=2975995 RepID=UPI0038660C2C|nr:DoxX family protein [Nocardia sp. NBC_00881]
MTGASTVLAAALALVFLLLGAAKVQGVQPMRSRATHLGFAAAAFRGIGAAEIAGAAGLLVGISWPVVGAAAGTGLVLLLTGAVVAHLRADDGIHAVVPALITGLVSIGYLATLSGGHG